MAENLNVKQRDAEERPRERKPIRPLEFVALETIIRLQDLRPMPMKEDVWPTAAARQ